MDTNNWRTQLQDDSRQKFINKIMDTLQRHLPFFEQEELQEIKKIAVRFEEKIYTAATSQFDYLEKISLKMSTMETKYSNTIPDPASNSKNPPGSASLNSTAPTGNPNGGDWQEEVYQKVKAMKDMYFLDLNEIYQKIIANLQQLGKAENESLDLNEIYQKIIAKLQQIDSLPQQPKSEQLEKLKVFKTMLERFITFLQLPKSDILAGYRDKLGLYEKQIVNVLNSRSHKPPGTLQQGQALPPPHLHSVQQSQQATGNLK